LVPDPFALVPVMDDPASMNAYVNHEMRSDAVRERVSASFVDPATL